MICIGLTGTIASGKSTVAAYFKSLNIDVINADDIARSLTAVGEPALAKIVEYFGSSILEADGTLNRRALRTEIFTNKTARLWLEALLHPLIRKQIEIEIKNGRGPYCVVEIPLLKNKADYPYLSRILLIEADETTQIERLMARDHCSKKEALAILQQQPPLSNYKALADDVLCNNENQAALFKKINVLHERYLMDPAVDAHCH
jgi:dephospho-CoA kinase